MAHAISHLRDPLTGTKVWLEVGRMECYSFVVNAFSMTPISSNTAKTQPRFGIHWMQPNRQFPLFEDVWGQIGPYFRECGWTFDADAGTKHLFVIDADRRGAVDACWNIAEAVRTRVEGEVAKMLPPHGVRWSVHVHRETDDLVRITMVEEHAASVWKLLCGCVTTTRAPVCNYPMTVMTYEP